MKEKLVVIGNGMSGLRVIEDLLELENDKYDITVYGDEPYVNYNRIMLSYILSQEKTFEDTIINHQSWYDENNITLNKGDKVVSINKEDKTITSKSGKIESYDKLLIATGSNPFIPTTPGSDLNNVIAFRNKADVDTIISTIDKSKTAVVVGGGLLGLEAAYGIAMHGVKTILVHRSGSILSQQLDTTGGRLLQKNLESYGIEFKLNTTVKEISGTTEVETVTFSDGKSVESNIVVFATGIIPNKELAIDAGLESKKGILVDDFMKTSDESIFAVGECVEHNGNTYGLVAPLYEQGKVLAKKLAGKEVEGYSGSTLSTRLKISGVDLFSAGDYLGDETTEELILLDEKVGVYKKLVIYDNKIIGIVLYGDTADASWYLKLLKEHTDISDLRTKILFGKSALGDSGHGGDDVNSMSDDEEVCGCNGVCKGDIVNAIKDKDLKSLDDVKGCTKAGASCGSCIGLVEQILVNTLGDEYDNTPQGICGCTDKGHAEIKQIIDEGDFDNVYDVFKKAQWKTEDGCAKCRPAVNYYLLAKYNDDKYMNDKRSALVNDRNFANIQKDGTYSVVPRIWGGLTTPKELKDIADIAVKYEVPTIKFTGGQRLDMFGVTKEQLAPMWKDLNDCGFVSGQAYAKGLRTVKTCVGNTYCRFGTQDSMGMGVKLEKLTWGSWTPHKYKIAVSGCPRNCAEATIKDFGVIGVDSGWELHIAGNGGIKVRVTDLLCKVETEEEVYEYTKAFMQFYREDAYYLERTAHWIERVGLQYIKDDMLNEEKRKYWAARFDESQKSAQVDPWAKAIEDGFTKEFDKIVINPEDSHSFEPKGV
ncbi:nitrite reductase large subunit [Malaciobacter pacificus]|uniref:NADH-dependent nitrite reductase, catalytic subunit n=1 Tax=Malaciobacter pacificus TaxID=1080223 RepID=A0A5C2HG57_9BACT|nr:nitrite reductase large subunit NirB [Malaciobacter pacificus]QEP35402.1 NADH-dependent nitrite reductase, catalytic subunit [Malaciobacter pacificus]GGD38755.1 nitrite reductase large subunit [Malaciobacter pacificus]